MISALITLEPRAMTNKVPMVDNVNHASARPKMCRQSKSGASWNVPYTVRAWAVGPCTTMKTIEPAC